jgi:hypothetical protein
VPGKASQRISETSFCFDMIFLNKEI